MSAPVEPASITVRALLHDTWTKFNKDHTDRLGAALAYYSVFSVAPILVIAVAVAGFVFGPDAARGELSVQLQGLLGEEGAAAVETMIVNTDVRGGGVRATVVSAATLLVGATSAFVQLQGALNQIWEAPPSKLSGGIALLRGRMLSFAMVLVVGFLLLVSLVSSAVISGLAALIERRQDAPGLMVQVVDQGASFLGATALFALLFKVLPDVRVRWGDVWVGAAVTSALFAVGKLLIGRYLGNSAFSSAYGAAGSFAVLLVWVYYSAQILLFGATFTHEWARRRGSRAPP